MGRVSKYPDELRERAVRMVAEVRPQYPLQWAAITAVVLVDEDSVSVASPHVAASESLIVKHHSFDTAASTRGWTLDQVDRRQK